jgi:hypothetical protein
MAHKMGKKKSTPGLAGIPQPLAVESTRDQQSQGRSSICQTVSGKSAAALILPPVARESGECVRPRCSLHASFDGADRPSSARSAMFIVTTTPERPVKLRRSGIQGEPRPTSGSVRVSSNTCRSYGAWPTAARLTINMALLTELSASPPPLLRRAKDACRVQRPRAQRRPHIAGFRTFLAYWASRKLLRPRTGALRRKRFQWCYPQEARGLCDNVKPLLIRCAASDIVRSTNPPRLPLDRRTRAGALFSGRASA